MNNNENDKNQTDVGAQQLQKNNEQKGRMATPMQNLARHGLNAATGGAWNKVRNAPVIGNAAKKAEDKLANKLGNNRLANNLANKKFGNNNPNKNQTNPENHQKPELGAPTKEGNNNPASAKNGDVGSRNLKNYLANKAKNLFNQRKKKKKNNESSEESSQNSENNSDSQNNNENENDNSSDSPISEKTKIRIKRKIIIRLVILAACALMILSLFAVIGAILTGGVVISAPVEASKKYDTDEFEAVTGEDSKYYEDEINYYKKLKSIKEDVNVNYVNAILLSYYYQVEEVSEDELEEMSEEELEEKYEETAGIDYARMTKNVDKFVEVLKEADSTDYSINGPVYSELENNSDFRDYYKEVLKKRTIDLILADVFDLAEELEAYDNYDETAITSETKVTTSGGSSSTMHINDYLADSIYANTSNLSNVEKIKAYTIAYSTNIVAENKKLSINSNSASASNLTCSIKEGCSYDANSNLVSGGGYQSSQNSLYYNGNYYYKIPLTTSEQNELNKNINSVFGNVLVSSSGTYPELNISKIDGFGDGDYKTILKNAYGDYKYKNVGENSYVVDGSYGNRKVLTPVTFYDQKDYASYKFCGLKGSTIGGSGCGVTAMAIVASTYEKNGKYDPIYMNNEARKRGLCGSSGTSQSFFSREASVMKYKYMGGSKYNKSLLNSVLKHLSEGHLVVVRIGSGHFTSGGHYMVLGGVDPETKKVYVYDPNNRSNQGYRKTGNGWYSFNDIIVKEAYNFYIIWKG